MMWLANCSRIISLGSIGCSARESSSLVNCPDICQDANWISKIARDLGRKVGAHIDVELGEGALDGGGGVVVPPLPLLLQLLGHTFAMVLLLLTPSPLLHLQHLVVDRVPPLDPPHDVGRGAPFARRQRPLPRPPRLQDDVVVEIMREAVRILPVVLLERFELGELLFGEPVDDLHHAVPHCQHDARRLQRDPRREGGAKDVRSASGGAARV
eukprot:COSAG04_NODE_6936_length_1226_cov_0.779059_1_plen_211_part_10